MNLIGTSSSVSRLSSSASGIDELQPVGGRQRAPGVLLRGEIEVHDGAMLRQAEPALAAPDLFELLLCELALLEQEVRHVLLRRIRGLVH